jgi:hypothetical protein
MGAVGDSGDFYQRLRGKACNAAAPEARGTAWSGA